MKIIYNLEQKRLTYATPPKTHKKRKQHSPNTQKKIKNKWICTDSTFTIYKIQPPQYTKSKNFVTQNPQRKILNYLRCGQRASKSIHQSPKTNSKVSWSYTQAGSDNINKLSKSQNQNWNRKAICKFKTTCKITNTKFKQKIHVNIENHKNKINT